MQNLSVWWSVARTSSTGAGRGHDLYLATPAITAAPISAAGRVVAVTSAAVIAAAAAAGVGGEGMVGWDGMGGMV